MKRYSIFTNKIKRYSLACFTMLCAMATFNSCHDDTFDSYGSGDGSEVNVKVFLTVPAPSIATRASSGEIDDSYYNQDGVYLLVFDGDTDNSNLLQIVQATGGSKIFYAKLKSRSDAHYIYTVANAENIVKANQSIWESNPTKLSDIKKAFKYTLTVNKEGLLNKMVNPQPMIYKSYLENGIDASTKLGTSADDPIKMERSTVKISIYNDTAEKGTRAETLYGANLANTPTEGYLFPMNESDLGNITRTNTCGEDGSFNTSIVAPAQGSTSCYLYSFESVKKDKQSTAVVIKATYFNEPYYYRIDLDTENSNYALLRNFNYIVHIQSIEQAGYATPEEALSNRAGNIKYIVSVTDAYSRDIVSNGEYYLGVENSEFYAFTDEGIKDQLVSVVMHTAPSTVAPGTFTPSSGITITSGNSFPENKGGEQKVELRISTTADFISGNVKIQLGDLERTILIYKRAMPGKLGTILKDFKEKGYISGKVSDKDTYWIRLTNKKTAGDLTVNDLTEEDLFSSLEAPDENIHLRVKSYIADNTSDEYRYGTVDLFRKDKGGNARISIKQPRYDIYTEVIGQAKVAPYTYVGTFHRHDQVGERIIRVKAEINGGKVTKWRVFVVYGDFIRLSLDPSLDGGVGTTNFYGDGDTTDKFGYDVEQFPVENGGVDYTQISDHIYFRVGLTSKISEKSVRYGIIGLQFNGDVGTEKVTRYIFVRQGEEADYLMRPEDPALKEPGKESTSEVLTRREKALKISPYNLTAPAKDRDKVESYLNGVQGVFTDYPSQAGYLYQEYTRRGWQADWDLHGKYKFTNFNVSDNPAWQSSFETCPAGYVHPSGGYDDGKTSDFKIDASVQAAAIRQSLWLYPKNGVINSTQNFIIGYMADGFYDRQPMRKSETRLFEQFSQENTVSSGAQIAYIGCLVINPHNAASLFMPMTGYYINETFGQNRGFILKDAGNNGSFLTTTRVQKGTGYSGSYYTVDYGMIGGFRADNYTNHSPEQAGNVRCVRQQ